MLSVIKRKMWLKFIIAMAAILLVVGHAMVWLNNAVMKQITHYQVKNQSTDIAKIIENTMFDALAVGDNDTVRMQFKRIGSEIEDVEAIIYDYNGKVVFCTKDTWVGQGIGSLIDSPGAENAAEMLKSGKSRETFTTQWNEQAFAVVNRPIANAEKCFHCHGKSRNILGGITVLSSTQHAEEMIDTGVKNNILTGLAGLCLVIAFVWIFFHFLINKKVAMVLKATEKMRAGDFTFSTQMPSGDEMNYILNRIHLVNQTIREALAEVVESSGRLNESAKDLTSISETLDRSSRETSDNSSSVSSAAEEMTTTLNSIAASMEDAAARMNTIVSASEEMSSTVSEISRNANVAKDVVDRSVNEFTELTQVINRLGREAEEIDMVTTEISDIAEKVSLLALNAKIESARAGEAGRGFAVVAQEITDLSGDAGNSAKNVDERIKCICQQVKNTVSRIEKLSTGINESDEAVSSIATAVEEQSATSEEISGNISQVHRNIEDVGANVTEGAQVAGEIADRIGEVDAASTRVEENSSEVSAGAGKLSEMAEKLKTLVSRFTI